MIKSIKFDNKMILLLVAGIILLAGVVMLSRMNEGDQKSIVHKVAADADRYMAGDVEGLVKNADYIVSGKFERSSKRGKCVKNLITKKETFRILK